MSTKKDSIFMKLKEKTAKVEAFGCLDSLNGRLLSGWFFSDDSNDLLSIFLNDKLLGVCKPAKVRDDLIAKFGDQAVAFQYILDTEKDLIAGDEIRVVSMLSKIELKGSPFKIQEKNLGKAQYHIDSVSSDNISGWAWHPYYPKEKIYVESRLSGRFSSAVSAASYREDLEKANMNDGCYGFSLPVKKMIEGDKLEVYFYLGNKLVAVEEAKVSSATTNISPDSNVVSGNIIHFEPEQEVHIFSWGKQNLLKRLVINTSENVLSKLSDSCVDEHAFPIIAPSAYLAYTMERHAFNDRYHLRTQKSLIDAFFDIAEAVYKHDASTVPISYTMKRLFDTRVNYQGRSISLLLKEFITKFRPNADVVSERGYQNACYDLLVTFSFIWGVGGEHLPGDVLSTLQEKQFVQGLGEVPSLFMLLLENNPEFSDITNNVGGFLWSCTLSLAGRNLLHLFKFPLLDKLLGEFAKSYQANDYSDSIFTTGIKSIGISMDNYKDVVWKILTEYGISLDSPVLSTELQSNEKFVRVFGDIELANGLSTNIDNTVKALESANISYKLYNTKQVGKISPISTFNGTSELSCNINLYHIQPDNLPKKLLSIDGDLYDDAYNIGFFMWETDAKPKVHDLALTLVDEIWTATTYTYDYFRSVFSGPITLIPHAVEPELPSERNFRQELGTSDFYTFFYAFDLYSCIERKNPIAVVKAFQQAFPGVSDVRLVIKANHADKYSDVETNFGHFESLIELQMQDPRILIFKEKLLPQDNSALMNSCDAFVSLHRSEGFGYSLAEAMYFNKPVIATAYSGNLEFMNHDNSYLVDVEKLIFIKGKEFLYNPIGGRWANADINIAAEKMYHVYNQPDMAKKLGETAGEHIKSQFSLDVMSEKYKNRIEAINV